MKLMVAQGQVEVAMLLRNGIIVAMALSLNSCDQYGRGKVIFTEDTQERYVVIREHCGNSVESGPAHIDGYRPDLNSVEYRGDLEFVFTCIHHGPRIVVESKDPRRYQVVCQPWDPEAIQVVARGLGLVVATEDRVISAMTIREGTGGHRLKPAAEGKQVDLERVAMNGDGTWPLDGVTMDGLARFLERRYRRPVVNLTSVEGRWSVLVSAMAGKMWPQSEPYWPLDATGFVMGWEKVTIPVTVVKDQQRKEGD